MTEYGRKMENDAKTPSIYKGVMLWKQWHFALTFNVKVKKVVSSLFFQFYMPQEDVPQNMTIFYLS